jgi:phenylacetate-CoA ligase
VVPLHVYRGRDFYRLSGLLDQSQYWDAERMRQYQDTRVAALVAHAYAHVPYYRQIFDQRGLSPTDVTTVAHLARLPLVTKDDVRAHAEALRSRAVPDRDVVWKSTSGTTGRPVKVAVLKSLLPFDNDAYHWRQFRWGGCGFEDPRATLLASTLSNAASPTRRLSAYDPRRRTLTLSTYDLHADTIAAMHAALRKHPPRFLMAFPSSAERFVVLSRQQGLQPPPLQAVFLQSESVLPWQRTLIADYFGCEVFDWYATEERVINACDCPEHDGLHVVSEFGVVEFLPTASTPDDGAHEVVATPFHNLAMPLLRYRTGDMAVPIDDPCGCGRTLPRMRIVGGRSRSYAVLADGRMVSITVVDIPKASAAVEQFQFVQDEPGVVTLKIVRKPGYGDADERVVRDNLREKFGDALRADIVYVDAIERTARGKLPLLVQHLDLSRYDEVPDPSRVDGNA